MKHFLPLLNQLTLISTIIILFSACGSVNNDIQPGVAESSTLEKTVESFLHPNAIDDVVTTQTLKLLVPLYTDPENGIQKWQQIADTASKVPTTVIINPSSGPLGCQSTKFQKALNLVTNQGVTVLGYVPTGFGSRNVALVQQDITNYQSCPQLGGIFLDEVSTDLSQADNIRSLCSYVRGAPSFGKVVLNAGTSIDNSILEFPFCDTVVSFEKDISQWVFSYNKDAVTFPNPDYFASLIYGTSTESIYQAIDLARARGFGFVHISSDALPNPWSTLPEYWDSVVNYIKLGNDLTPSPPLENSLLINSGFDTFEGWSNCGNTNSYYIANSALNVTTGACVYQTVPVTPGATYTLTCTGNTSAPSWNTFILSALDANWQTIQQDYRPLSTNISSQSITITAPTGAAHMAVGFYSEDFANYTSCILESSGGTPPTNNLVNSGFDTFEGWSNCSDPTRYYIANSNLNLTAGACVYQTITASAGRNYTLTCTGNINSAVWSTFILSALDSNWNTISQVYEPLELNSVTKAITLNAPTGTAHMAVSFYTEGDAIYQECIIN